MPDAPITLDLDTEGELSPEGIEALAELLITLTESENET